MKELEEILAATLTTAGYQVTLAADGNEGLENALAIPFDLVLTGPLVGAGGTQGAAPSSDDDGGCSTSGRSVSTASWFVALGLVASLARRRALRRIRDLKRW